LEETEINGVVIGSKFLFSGSGYFVGVEIRKKRKKRAKWKRRDAQ
jgi:hypothetical protein